MSFEFPKFSRVELDRFSNPFAELSSGRLSSVSIAPPPPPSPAPLGPPAFPQVLDIIERLDSCDVVGPLAAACLLSCGAVICMMFSRPIAKTAEFSLLVGAQLIGALVQAEYLYAWMAGPVDNSPDGSGGRFGRSTAFEVWLGQFSSFGTSLYFLTLSTQLLRTTLSPFNIGSTLGYHVATCSFAAALAAAAAHFERDVDTGGTRPGSAFLPDAETGRWILVGFRTAIYALALAMLVYSWRLILYGVQGDAAFTQRRRILTLALASILLSEAIFGLFPPLVPPILKYGLDLSDDVASCSTTILLGLQDVALASTWLVVFSCSERALRTARMRDTVSLEDGFVPEGAGDLSAALRSQLVSLITVGACRSARDMRDECGTGAGAMSPAACAADGEYRRVVPLARFEPPGALGRQMPVQVSSLAPRVFHELRRLAGVSTDDYVQSLSGEKTERFTEGRSGAFFYFTHDRRYIIKTATKAEFATLLRILPRYHAYVYSHPNTLINRIVGAHELALYGQRVRVMIVESCFLSTSPVHERYDLKGSWVGRGGKVLKRRGEVLKDLDVRERFNLAPEDARRVSRHLRDDVAFLAANNLIDYSLLVGVTKTRFEIEGQGARTPGAFTNNLSSGRHGTPFHRSDDGGLAAACVEGAELYSMGVIDILQDFNLRKRAEYLIKRFVCCRGRGVSVHPPAAYSNRFVRNVVEALLDPVTDSSVPRVFRGFTPAGSPLGQPALMQQRGRVHSHPKEVHRATILSRHTSIPMGRSYSRVSTAAEPGAAEVSLLSSRTARSDDTAASITIEPQVAPNDFAKHRPAPPDVVDDNDTRNCAVM